MRLHFTILAALAASSVHAGDQTELIARQQRLIAYQALQRATDDEARLIKIGKPAEAELRRRQGVKVILRAMRSLQIENESLRVENKQLRQQLSERN